MTNLTTLTDDQLVQQAIDYMSFIEANRHKIDLSQTLLMDETAVYFEDACTQTIYVEGRRHVIIESTGFSSM